MRRRTWLHAVAIYTWSLCAFNDSPPLLVQTVAFMWCVQQRPSVGFPLWITNHTSWEKHPSQGHSSETFQALAFHFALIYASLYLLLQIRFTDQHFFKPALDSYQFCAVCFWVETTCLMATDYPALHKPEHTFGWGETPLLRHNLCQILLFFFLFFVLFFFFFACVIRLKKLRQFF